MTHIAPFPRSWRKPACCLVRCAVSVVFSIGAGAAFAQSPRELVTRGNQALAGGDADAALRDYDQAAQLKPSAPQIAYNQAVAHYKKGDYAKAAESFSKALAMGDEALEAPTKFNLGNCAYQTALQKQDQPDQVMSQLKTAISYFRDAIAADPQSDDARVNYELAHELLKRIEKQQEQQQQEQQDQQSASQPSSQPKDQQQPSSQPQSSSQPNQQQGEENKDAQQQSEGEQSNEQESQGEEQSSDQQQTAEDDESKKDKLQAAPGEDEGEEEQQEGQPMKMGQMSKQDAERLLQLVRDKERQRREAQARRARARSAPVEKDW